MIALDFHAMNMDGIARELTRRLDRPVINETGIAGLVDLHVEFSPDEATPGVIGTSAAGVTIDRCQIATLPSRRHDLPVG